MLNRQDAKDAKEEGKRERGRGIYEGELTGRDIKL
jgi:hypothetical protein